MSRRPSQLRRGATLIEAMIAVVLLAVGTAAITELLKTVSHANNRMAFQSAAINLFAQFAAQVQDAPCEYQPTDNPQIAPPLVPPGQLDPGIVAATGAYFPNSMAGVPAPGSAITVAGPMGVVQGQDMNLFVRYQATFVGPGGVSPDLVPGYDFDVEIREVTGDPAQDNLANTSGYWIRQFPLKKLCNRRLEPGPGRG